jgi:hypothetical protein
MRLFRYSLLPQFPPHKINKLLMPVSLCVRDPFRYRFLYAIRVTQGSALGAAAAPI